MWAFKLNRNVMYGIVALILLVIAYNTVPAVEEKVNQVTDAFVEDSETKGSSIQMRIIQYASVLIRIEGHEWLGLGKGYWEHIFAEDRASVSDILGVESVILSYLLERGIIGLILWAAFYTIIFLYFWNNRKKRKKLTGLGVSILSLYLFFSIGTGELGSVYPTMLLLGIAMKMIDSKKRRLMLYVVLLRIMKRKKLTRRQQLIMILKAISR
jgi:O-antigen ligase